MERTGEKRFNLGRGSRNGPWVAQEILDDVCQTRPVWLVSKARPGLEDHRGILVPAACDHRETGPEVVHDPRPRAELVLNCCWRNGQTDVCPKVRAHAFRERDASEEFQDLPPGFPGKRPPASLLGFRHSRFPAEDEDAKRLPRLRIKTLECVRKHAVVIPGEESPGEEKNEWPGSPLQPQRGRILRRGHPRAGDQRGGLWEVTPGQPPRLRPEGQKGRPVPRGRGG